MWWWATPSLCSFSPSVLHPDIHTPFSYSNMDASDVKGLTCQVFPTQPNPSPVFAVCLSLSDSLFPYWDENLRVSEKESYWKRWSLVSHACRPNQYLRLVESLPRLPTPPSLYLVISNPIPLELTTKFHKVCCRIKYRVGSYLLQHYLTAVSRTS